ncbi:MAG: hypothetical protein HW405_161 [Candidatus Berkelbacteria bacterium]|nr:hypothetical protein [Candidatus Berkelbacteria bacterium]
MAYEIQFARITNSGKLPDRFLTCQHHTSDNLTQKGMGEIFTCIEMLSPWFPTAQVGQMVINNFVKYYYRGGSTSDLVNFEESLKKVNEDLAQITQNGETDWIGNLNGVTSVIVGNSLHLSTSGQSEVFIFRDGKINHLTEGMTGPVEPHPLKTFTNIISGELKEQDSILLSNKELFEHLSLEALRQIISMNPPSLAAMQIIKLLRKDKVKNVNLIIIRLGLKEDVSSKPITENLGNVFYLDKSSESAWKVFGQIGKILIPVNQSLGKFFNNSYLKIKERISKRKKSQPSIPINAQPFAAKEGGDNFHKEFLSGERDDSLLKDEEVKYSPEYVHYYNQEKEKKITRRNTWTIILKILNWIWIKILNLISWIVDSARDRKRRKYLYILGAILLILIIIVTVVIKNRGNNVGNFQAQKILNEAIAAGNDGKNLLSTGNQEQAKEKFAFSIDKARTIVDNSFVANDAKNTIKNSQSELDKLTATTRYIDLKPSITIPDTGKGLYVVSGQAYIISDSDIYEGNIVSGTPSKIASIPKNKGNFITGTRSDISIYLYTNNQNVFTLDVSTKKIEQTKISSDGRWETSNAIAGYVGSLYLLDGIVGQIYKHSSNNTEFQKGEEYISTVNVNLRQSNSLAVDGNIYVLKNDGQIIKIQKSKKQDFSLKNIPSPYSTIAKPIKIFTDSDTPSIYVLDGDQKRILEFDKEGQFIHQYALPDEFNKITDFVVSQKARKIWVLNDKSIYELSI